MPHNVNDDRGSAVWLVLRYAFTIFGVGVCTGFLIAIVERVAPDLLAKPMTAQLDLGGVLKLVGVVLICMIAYCQLAIRHAQRYLRLGFAIAVLTGLGNYISYIALAPAGTSPFNLWLLVVTLGFHVCLMVTFGLLFGPLRRGTVA
jgi:hypothetical protein